MAAFTLLDSPEGEKLVKKLWANTKSFKRELKKRGFQFKASETPIIPIHVGDAAKAFEFSKKVFEAGVFAPCGRLPDRGGRQGAATRDRERHAQARATATSSGYFGGSGQTTRHYFLARSTPRNRAVERPPLSRGPNATLLDLGASF